MSLGIDASFTHQDAAKLAADGVKAIGRYAPPADPGKCITLAELQALNAHGIAVWLVHERDAAQWRGGYPAGHLHGGETRAACRAIGWPDTRPIYAPYDQYVGSGDTPTFTAYQQGFNDGQAVSAGGAAYGDGYVLETLSAKGLIIFKWLSDSTAFPESANYARSGQASIVQFYGRTLPGLSGIDVDDLLTVDFGQYPAPTSTAPKKERQVDHLFKSPNGAIYWVSGGVVRNLTKSGALTDAIVNSAKVQGVTLPIQSCDADAATFLASVAH